MHRRFLGLSGKRSLAVREFSLGIEGLERFIARESLQQVHECVFGVLALESEPVVRKKSVQPISSSHVSTDDATRWLMSVLSSWFEWRNALVLVKPETLIRWHRKGFCLFWRWKSRPTGRPRLPKDLLALILQMAKENPTWGQEHIANELKLKLGIRISPRTVGKYLARGPCRDPDPSQRWLTFVRNHAQAIVACDFFVMVTARFRILYVFVLMELGRRRILHVNVTDHPSTEWTLQQLRESLPDDHPFRFLIHDRDSIFSTVGSCITTMAEFI